MTIRPILSIAGGGTGGHVMPALALADAARQAWPELKVQFIGAECGLEATLLPEQGEEPQRGPLRPSGAEDGVACGEISLELVALDSAQDPRRLDLTLSVSEWTGDARLVEIQLGEREVGEAVIATRRQQASLPSAHNLVLSRRVFLSPSGDGLLEFQGDLGHGRETLTLGIGKFSARRYR